MLTFDHGTVGAIHFRKEFLLLTDIFLIRHGLPDYQTGLAYNQLPGPGLVEQGRLEAAQAAEFLRRQAVEHLFVSPFARTTQTAEIITEALNIPLTFTALVQEHGPIESFGNVRERIRELITSADDSPFTCIGLVTHGSPVRAALQELTENRIDLSKHNYPGGNPAPTCGIWHAYRRGASWVCELAFAPPKPSA